MKFKSFFLAAIMTFSVACARNVMVSPDVKKVALVQCTVIQPMRALSFMARDDVSPVVLKQLPVLLQETESALRQYWNVIPAGLFVAKPELQKMSRYANSEDIMSPVINGRQMPALSDWKVGSLSKDTAKRLCALTGADAVVLSVSSWEVQTQGMFASAQYPLSYLSLAMYDKNGNLFFYDTAYEVYNSFYGYWNMSINDASIQLWKKMSVKLTRDILARYAR